VKKTQDKPAAFISTHLKLVEQELAAYQEGRDAEQLHLLRVAIKKVKAILDLLEANYDVNYDRKILKKVFNKAGKIRELHLNVLLLKRLHCQPESVIVELEKEKIELQEILATNIPVYIKGVKKFRKQADISFPLPSFNKIEKYLAKKRRKACRKFDAHTRNGMHAFRMKIKSLLFVYSVLPDTVKNKLGLPIELLQDLQEEVGAWHDTWAAIQFLQRKKLDQQLSCMEVLYQLEANQFGVLLSKYKKHPLIDASPPF
jgi:CHAD domain-containing protein